MRSMKMVVLLGCLALAAGAFAQKPKYYVMCNHPDHNLGKYYPVGGPFDTIAECDKSHAGHRSSHGNKSQTYTSTCSARTTPPK